MMTTVDKYLATEMFECNALSQFNVALFIPWRMALWFMSKPEHSRPYGHKLIVEAGTMAELSEGQRHEI